MQMWLMRKVFMGYVIMFVVDKKSLGVMWQISELVSSLGF